MNNLVSLHNIRGGSVVRHNGLHYLVVVEPVRIGRAVLVFLYSPVSYLALYAGTTADALRVVA